MITLLASKVGRALALALATLVGLGLIFHAGSRQGARRYKEKQDEKDRKTASGIRRDVDAVPDRVRPDEIIYRD